MTDAGARGRRAVAHGDRPDRAPCSGVGLASFVNIFNPEVIVVGGGVMAAGDLLLEPARDGDARAGRCEPGRDLVRVVAAKFGPEAGMLGAGGAGARRAG